MGSVLKLLGGKTIEFISVVKVPDSYSGDFFEYQPISITVKDGEVIYAAYLGQQSPSIDQAINDATAWVDRYFYGMD